MKSLPSPPFSSPHLGSPAFGITVAVVIISKILSYICVNTADNNIITDGVWLIGTVIIKSTDSGFLFVQIYFCKGEEKEKEHHFLNSNYFGNGNTIFKI